MSKHFEYGKSYSNVHDFLESQLYIFMFSIASTKVKVLVREIITVLSFVQSQPSRQYSEFNK